MAKFESLHPEKLHSLAIIRPQLVEWYLLRIKSQPCLFLTRWMSWIFCLISQTQTLFRASKIIHGAQGVRKGVEMLVFVINAIDQSIRGTACLKGAWKRPGVCSGNMEGQFKERDIPHSCPLCASVFFPSHPSSCFKCAKNPPELCHDDDGSTSAFVGLITGELGWLCWALCVELFQLKWFMICSFAGDKRVVCDLSAEVDRHGLPSAMHSWCAVMRLSEACVMAKPAGKGWLNKHE